MINHYINFWGLYYRMPLLYAVIYCDSLIFTVLKAFFVRCVLFLLVLFSACYICPLVLVILLWICVNIFFIIPNVFTVLTIGSYFRLYIRVICFTGSLYLWNFFFFSFRETMTSVGIDTSTKNYFFVNLRQLYSRY